MPTEGRGRALSFIESPKYKVMKETAWYYDEEGQPQFDLGSGERWAVPDECWEDFGEPFSRDGKIRAMVSWVKRNVPPDESARLYFDWDEEEATGSLQVWLYKLATDPVEI